MQRGPIMNAASGLVLNTNSLRPAGRKRRLREAENSQLQNSQ